MRASRCGLMVGLALSLAGVARADVTVRSRVTITPGPQFPPALQQKITQALSAVPMSSVLILKNGVVWTAAGNTATRLDLNTLQVTEINLERKQYATAAMSELATNLNQMLAPLLNSPTAQQAPKGITFTAEIQDTGKTDTVLGIAVTETEVVMAATLDPTQMKGGGAGLPAMKLGRIELHFWRATQQAILQNPPLLDLARLNGAAWTVVNPAGPLFQALAQKMLGQQFGDVIAKLQANTAPVLRLQADVYSPFVGMLAKMSAGRGQSALAGGDWNSPDPLIAFDSQAVSLSGDPVDAAAVAIPDGLQQVSLEEFMKAAYPVPKLPTVAVTPAGVGTGLPAGLGQPAAKRLPPGPYAGQPMAAASLAWLANPGDDAAMVRANTAYASLLSAAVPNAMIHLGRDRTIADALQAVLARGTEPPVAHGDVTEISALRVGQYPAGMLWVDRKTGIAVGALLWNPTNDGPAPEITLFSNQISGKIQKMEQLPAAFSADFEQWADRTPGHRAARYFINAQGEKSVLIHEEDYCQVPGWQQAHQTDCATANRDSARVDHAAVLYAEAQQQGISVEVLKKLTETEAAWDKTMQAQCGSPVPLSCELTATQARVRELLGIQP